MSAVPDRSQIDAALIADRLAGIEDRIAAVGGRGVEILAVTKSHPAAVVAAALDAGCGRLGESYAQELVAKDRALRDIRDVGQAGSDPGSSLGAPVSRPPRWCFIGQLQTNKVRLVAPLVDMVCSVDRSRLVEELARRAPGIEVMIEVDLSGEPGRGGCPLDDAGALIDLAASRGLRPVGLMGVAPLGDVRTVSAAFRSLRSEVDRLHLPQCSMGMTADLETAVEEGSTMVRIGTALFGARN